MNRFQTSDDFIIKRKKQDLNIISNGMSLEIRENIFLINYVSKKYKIDLKNLISISKASYSRSYDNGGIFFRDKIEITKQLKIKYIKSNKLKILYLTYAIESYKEKHISWIKEYEKRPYSTTIFMEEEKIDNLLSYFITKNQAHSTNEADFIPIRTNEQNIELEKLIAEDNNKGKKIAKYIYISTGIISAIILGLAISSFLH